MYIFGYHTYNHSIVKKYGVRGGVKLSRFGDVRAENVMAVQIGPIVWGSAPCVPDRKDLLNVAEGMLNRALRHVGKYQAPNSLPDILNKFRSEIEITGEPPSFEYWLLSRSYSCSRKQELERAWVNRNSPKADDWSTIKCHIKAEFYPKFKFARMINARVDSYKVLAGPWFQWIESCIFKHESFIKKVPMEKRPAHVMSMVGAYPYIYVLDYGAYEASITAKVMQDVEAKIYRWFGLPEEFIKPLVAKQRMIWRGGNSLKVRAVASACRMSGDMCTSLGNGLTNKIITESIARDHGVTMSGVYEGDDGIVGCDKPLKESWYKKVGFDIDLIPVEHPGDAGFCSMYWTQQGTYLASPFRLIKFGWSCNIPPNTGSHRRAELLGARANSLAFELGSSPIFWAFADRYRMLGRQPDDWHLRQKLDAANIPYNVHNGWLMIEKLADVSQPTDYDRLEYERIFKITVASQKNIESQIKSGAQFLNDDMLQTVILAEYPDMVECWHRYARES